MKRDKVPRSLLERIEAELLAGEELLWAGQPGSSAAHDGVPLASSQTMAVIFGLLLAGVLVWGIFPMLTVKAFRMPLLWISLAVLFVGIGVMAVVLSRTLALSQRQRHIAYAITDRRALILTAQSVQSYSAKDMQFIERRMRDGDRGDLIFQRETWAAPGYYSSRMYSPRRYERQIGFFDIPNVRQVEALMLETFHEDGADKPKRRGSGAAIFDDDDARGRDAYRL